MELEDRTASTDFTRPPEWSDEERMYFLLAPFPSSVKPTLSDATKVAFWRSLIITSSKELQQLVFSERQLTERFRWRGSEPKCLRAVIECLECSGETRKLSSYVGDGGSVGWWRWGVQVVTKPFSWAWRWYWGSKVRGSERQDVSEEQYVLVTAIKVSFTQPDSSPYLDQ